MPGRGFARDFIHFCNAVYLTFTEDRFGPKAEVRAVPDRQQSAECGNSAHSKACLKAGSRRRSYLWAASAQSRSSPSVPVREGEHVPEETNW